MTRRGGQLPWGNSSRGIYDGHRGGGYRQLLVLALIVLGTLALGWFLFSKACGSEACAKEYCASGKTIAPPEGYELVTQVYKFSPTATSTARCIGLTIERVISQANKAANRTDTTETPIIRLRPCA